MIVKISRESKAALYALVSQRLTPSRYEEPNREEAVRIARLMAEQVLADVFAVVEKRIAKIVAPATVEV